MRLNSGLLLTAPRFCCSLCLRPGFDNFRKRLQQCLPLLDKPTLATTDDEGIDAALEVLQIERQRENAVEVEKGVCDSVGGGSLGSSAVDQDENMVDETDQPQTAVDEVDNALKILVRNAIEEFGLIPRDAYEGVFNLHRAKARHAIGTRKLDFPDGHCQRVL